MHAHPGSQLVAPSNLQFFSIPARNYSHLRVILIGVEAGWALTMFLARDVPDRLCAEYLNDNNWLDRF